MPVSDIDILKKILVEEETETLRFSFEEDPMGFILNKYPGLNNVLEYMMTKDFRQYLGAIFIVAPKPTTFKIVLHNGQHFFLQFMGKAYQATVLGKNYYLMTIGEKERCMIAIARLLRYGVPLKTKGPEEGEAGGELGGELGGETGGEETGGEETGGEEGGEALEESKILSHILKESLFEAEDEDQSQYILNVFKSYNPSGAKKIGSKKYEVVIPSVKSTGAESRKQRYEISKKLAAKSNVKAGKDPNGSPFVSITKGNQTYKVYIKGFTEGGTNTDIKEGLTIMFYYSDVKDPVTEGNFKEVVDKLKALTQAEGLGERDRASIQSYLESAKYSKNVADSLNQSLSQALAIREAYPGLKVTRTGIFDAYKVLAKKVLGLDKDKWCPADLFVLVDQKMAESLLQELTTLASSENVDQLEFTAKINGVFNNKFGDTIKPITGVSLKFEQAQLGKAKSYLDRQYSDVEDTFNVTAEEQKYPEKTILQKISEFRRNIQKILKSRTEKVQIEYVLEDEKVEKDKIRGKFAGLKAINYWFNQVYSKYGANKIDNALVDITKFAMSLTTLNPTFFKVRANKDGSAGEVIEFSQGVTMSLIKNKPIKIIDSPNYKGVKIMLPIKRTENGAQESTMIQISAKSNGNTQGTIELEKGSLS